MRPRGVEQQRGRVRELGPLLRERHGARVRKVCLRLGASCPNRDGTLATTGCLFCADPALPAALPLDEQLAAARERLPPGAPAIAYLQDHTATHVPLARLTAALELLACAPGIVAIHLGTRPDALPLPVLALLQRIAAERELLVELGLQSADDEVLRALGRQHDVACFARAVEALHTRGARVCAHVVLGLPAPRPDGTLRPEGSTGAAASARLLGALGVEAVKLHNCHILAGTGLARLHAEGRFEPPGLERYLELVIAFLEELPAVVELHRLTGEARRPALIAPAFTAEKARTLQRLRALLEERDVWQGSRAGQGQGQAPATPASDDHRQPGE